MMARVGLLGRIMLVLLGALSLLVVATFGIDQWQRGQERSPYATRFPRLDQAGGIMALLRDSDPAQRPAILRAINEGLVARYIVKPWNRDELRQVLRWATEVWTFGKDSAELQRRLLETERLASLGSIAAATSARGFNLLVSFQENPDNFRADFVASGLADAMIVIGTTSNRAAWDYFAQAQASGLDFVCWGSPGDPFHWMRSDNEDAVWSRQSVVWHAG